MKFALFRFEVAPPAGQTVAQFAATRKLIHMRACVLLRKWLSTSPDDFDDALLTQVCMRTHNSPPFIHTCTYAYSLKLIHMRACVAHVQSLA